MNKTNIMLAGGKGERFRKEYIDPKPLIPVGEEPMVLKAATSFPSASQNIFLCLQEHIDIYHIDKKIKQHIPSAEIIPIAQVTQGQASTCLLAKNFVDANNAITIGSCDNGMVYNREKFEKLLMDENTDVIIWTFRNNPNVKRKPEAWGWVKIDDQGLVQEVSVKIPISDTSMNDHAVVGWFSFKNAGTCFAEIEDMIKKDIRINNEFYLDKLADLMAKKGYKVRVFEIDIYVGWGTPADLQTYQKWEAHFKNQNKEKKRNYTVDQEELAYWKKYFL